MCLRILLFGSVFDNELEIFILSVEVEIISLQVHMECLIICFIFFFHL